MTTSAATRPLPGRAPPAPGDWRETKQRERPAATVHNRQRLVGLCWSRHGEPTNRQSTLVVLSPTRAKNAKLHQVEPARGTPAEDPLWTR